MFKGLLTTSDPSTLFKAKAIWKENNNSPTKHNSIQDVQQGSGFTPFSAKPHKSSYQGKYV